MNLLDLFTISVAHAQLPLPGVVDAAKAPNTVLGFVCNFIFTWIFTIAIILSIVLILVAAYKYLTSAGDPGKVKSATQSLIFVAIGIAVAIMARSVPIIVGSFVSSGVNLDPCSGTTPTTQTTTKTT